MKHSEEREILHKAIDLIYAKKKSMGTSSNEVAKTTPEAVEAFFDLDTEIAPEDSDQLIQIVQSYINSAVLTDSYKFMNRMWAGANFPSILGEIVTAAIQSDAGSFEAGPASVVLERYMISQMLELSGFTEGEGQMTTGSSNANMVAMLCARNFLFEDVKKNGVCNAKAMQVFASADAHYSLDRAVNTLGIGLENLIKIPVDEYGAMKIDALEEAIERSKEIGARPFFVVATAGTTVRGAYDSIEELLFLREKYGFWLHVDGAWGGSAVLSESLKERYLKGLEAADSFTWDFHKMPGTNLICNVLLFNNRPGIMKFALGSGDMSYLHRKEEGGVDWNPGSSSLQCGRKIDSLKWYLDWKYFTRKGLAERMEHYLSLAEAGEKYVRESAELEMVSPRVSFNLCFRSTLGDNDFNKKLRDSLHQSGKLLIAFAWIQGVVSLRMLFTHPRMQVQDVTGALKTIELRARELSESA
jgi:glutamate/tyrosine decarboxylase-like PLP-dependent enzyme